MTLKSRAGAFLSALLLLTAFAGSAWPQAAPAPAPAEKAAPAPAPPEKDPYGRETPQGMVAGLMNALAAADYERAVQYFQTDSVQGLRQWYTLSGATLARRFQEVLDRGGSVVTPAELSSDPSGNVNDGLAPDVERFGEIKADGQKAPLLAKRIKRDDKMLWLVSEATLDQIPLLARELTGRTSEAPWVDFLPEGPSVAGAPASHWLILIVLAALSFGLAWALTGLREPIERLIRRGGAETKLSRFIEKCAGPMRLIITVLVFGIAAQAIGVSVIARYRAVFAVQIVGWFALAWLLWRCADAASEVVLGRMSRLGQLTAYSAVSFLNRAFKVLLAVLLVAAFLRAFGVNVTAGFAALGVGGLAIALGAQKLFENLIGSLTLIADRPVRIGDFCRFGDTLGTVEEIGIRSTRIRTLDRTILTVPNGEFSTLHIENYSHRDRFWFHPTLNLRYETTADQMRFVIKELREMLAKHPKIQQDSLRVRMTALGTYSLNVEIFAYIFAWDYSTFLEIQEDLLLGCMEIVEKSGTGFALPSSTLFLGRDGGVDEKRTRAAEKAMRRSREAAE